MRDGSWGIEVHDLAWKQAAPAGGPVGLGQRGGYFLARYQATSALARP